MVSGFGTTGIWGFLCFETGGLGARVLGFRAWELGFGMWRFPG